MRENLFDSTRCQQRKSSRLIRLGGLAMLASLFLTVGQVDAGNDYVSDTAGKRWTDGGTSYETREEYQNVDLEYEEFSMLWELYEGSIALT